MTSAPTASHTWRPTGTASSTCRSSASMWGNVRGARLNLATPPYVTRSDGVHTMSPPWPLHFLAFCELQGPDDPRPGLTRIDDVVDQTVARGDVDVDQL